jgi:hypothetical protein
MSSLAVDKIKKKVSLSLADRTQLSGSIFLSHYSELGVGQETFIDTLTGSGLFIPFETPEGEFSFINQKQIVWVASLLEPSEDQAPIPVEKRNVTVLLRDGKLLRGDLLMAMPEEKSRLSDWLNELKNFMVLRDEKREVLVNVDFVVRVF